MFGNPVAGFIRPDKAGTVPATPHVTSTFAEHVASGRGPGVDIGGLERGHPILAQCDGTVAQVFTAANGAKVVRYDSTEHPGWQPAIAHMDTLDVRIGQAVKRGQQIGKVGSSGAAAVHLHMGLKHNGVEVDGWPLLDQNQAAPDCAAAVKAATDPLNSEIAALKAQIAAARSALA
jgi:murein DD-endopeptidase MepM/ murein hydrolase activator NlpD